MVSGDFNAIDLFSGCGGLSFGFSLTGVNVLLGLDIDSASLETFKRNHIGSVVINKKVEEVTGEDISKASVTKPWILFWVDPRARDFHYQDRGN